MAGFYGHFATGVVLGGAYAAAGVWYGHFDWGTMILAGLTTAIGALTPDLDSDSGLPIRELFGLAGAINNGGINTVTTVKTSQATVIYGTTVTFTITVRAQDALNDGAGAVELFDNGSHDLGGATLITTQGPYAMWSFTTLPKSFDVTNPPAHVITAIYSGSATLSGSSGSLAGGEVVKPKSLTITASTNTKTYDGSTSAAAIPVVSGLVGTDTVTGLAEVYTSPSAGAGKSLSASTFTVGDGNNGKNYAVTKVVNLSGSINKATLTISIGTPPLANDKIYDATTKATLNTAGLTLVGVLPGDSVQLVTKGAAGTFDSKDVGTHIKVTTAGFSLSDSEAGDYTLVQPTTTASITAASLSVHGITAKNKVYDGTSAATLNLGTAYLTGFYSSDDVHLVTAGASGAFTNEDVEKYKLISISGLAITGAQKDDYSLTATTTRADITPAPLTVTGITANNKTYDGTTVATLNTSHAVLVGVIGNDAVTLVTAGVKGIFANKNVGAGITVTMPALTISGAEASDYALILPTAHADITQATLTLAPTIGAWSSGGTLLAARYDQAATLLANGKVLVTGGLGNTGILASAELYNPATNSWSSAGSMDLPRESATATLLPNGKVLVIGGYNTGPLASAELYDPASNTWFSAEAMGTPREDHTATLLDNGKVLVTGGRNNSGDLASAELYDPASNTWSSAHTMAAARSGQTATLLANGLVLVAGGRNSDGYLASVELYDTVANTWRDAHAMATPRFNPSATLLVNGRVLIVGGSNNYGAQASAELYDPAKNQWSPASFMANPRGDQTATLLPDGRVLVAGGFNNLGALSSAELYNPATNSWSSATAMSKARQAQSSTLLRNGLVLVVGGLGSGVLAGAELYDPAGQPPPLVNNKMYDGTTKASLNLAGFALAGVYPGDLVNLGAGGAKAMFASKNVGTHITVTVSDLALSGAQAGNYVLQQPTGSANITPAPLTITASTNTKTYDQTTAAAALPKVSGLLGNDTVTGLAEVYSSASPGKGKTLSVSAYTVSDANSGKNYTLTLVPNTTGVVRGPLIYNASANAGVTAYSLRYNSPSGNLELFDTSHPTVVLASLPLSITTGVVITGHAGGSDTLTIDYSAGYFFPGGITFNGGGSGKLKVIGSNVKTTNHSTGSGGGTLLIHPSSGEDTTVTYTGLAP